MPKRARSPVPDETKHSQKVKGLRLEGVQFKPIKVATMEAASAVDSNPPYFKLKQLIDHSMPDPDKGKVIFYWMRFADIRITDNRALYKASELARKADIPIAILFVLSPEDYLAHDRSSRRIDFVLRNLKLLQDALSGLHIPFYVITHRPRRTLTERVFELLREYGCRHLYANLEHELDELRRDIRIWELGERHGIQVNFFHDKCIIEPGVVLTKQAKGYTVFSPYWRNWLDTLNANLGEYLEKCPVPLPNKESIRQDEKLSLLFEAPVPNSVNGFELSDSDAANMKELWPAGESAAFQVLDRFLKTKPRSSQLGAVDPLSPDAQDGGNRNRIHKYHQLRDKMDKDTTSRLSVYLSSGVISVRECVRQTMQLTGSKKVDGNTSAGIGRWIQELAWRDFYTGILAHYPRVSMGRPYLEKYSNVVWENHQAPQDSTGGHEHHDSENFKRWKEGMTGVPIVDAAMRCMNEMGWVHNRARMITAMYLTKDLMIDWRLGERYFMQTLIDGDLASNNGGWQWSASTGVDPCPYFRIFNPHSQSLKADPTGEFIRHWVPELKKLHGPEIHNPSTSTADKLGYPRKVIEHSEARDRALRRFKNPGEA